MAELERTPTRVMPEEREENERPAGDRVEELDPRTARSAWKETLPKVQFAPLVGSIKVDVAIVGGGITGLTSAYELVTEGRSVALIEAGRVAHGESGLTSAHLTAYPDGGLRAIVSDFNVNTARTFWNASMSALERIRNIAEHDAEKCGLREVPALLWTEQEGGLARFEEELGLLREVGGRAQLHTMSLGLPFPARATLEIAGQARIDAGSYLSTLVALVKERGVQIFEGSRVIVASHVPIHTRVLLHTKIAAYRTYVLGVRTRAAMPDVLAWDDEDPYHYVRWAHIDGDPALLIGGEDHRTGADEHESVHFDRLQSWATERLGPLEPLRRWSGQIIEPVDGLPYVGVSSFSKHVFVATGYRGNGMTLGTASARALCDAIVGRENELASVFDATRITPLASAADFTASTIQAARHFIGDRLRTERTHPGRLKPGEGGIYLHRGSKYAISITEDGSVHCLSATCPHLGCVVAWNDAERTWDCPCHGSRFDPTGRVLNGPAIEGLKVDHSPLSGETHAT